jgi:Protein of unknown function (DUF2637)
MNASGEQAPRTRPAKQALRRIAARLRQRREGQSRQPGPDTARILRVPRLAALILIAILIGVASAASFAESYRGLYEWARHHGLAAFWAVVWPVQVDVFIAVGELALFVALIDDWRRRDRAGAWAATILGLAVSIAGNVGHVTSHAASSRATAAVPPLAAASALAVGLCVLKRVVAARRAGAGNMPAGIPAAKTAAVAEVAFDALDAARRALTASVAAGNPISQRQLLTRFGISRTEEREMRQQVCGAPPEPPRAADTPVAALGAGVAGAGSEPNRPGHLNGSVSG